MPEQLTKHPEVTIRVLQTVGAQCGQGAEQEILTSCPSERFCKLPGGEICVYGLPDVAKMTQITVTDWNAITSSLHPSPSQPSVGALTVGAAIVALLAGVVIGWLMSRLRKVNN